jgi:uncharacterized protein
VIDIDSLGRTPLHYAASGDDEAATQAEILRGADVGLADHQGSTPLHFAAQQGSVSVAALLLANGAPVDATDQWGNTPLWHAVFNSRGEGAMIQLLADAGADFDHRNASGKSPRQLAGLIANYDVAQWVPRDTPTE